MSGMSNIQNIQSKNSIPAKLKFLDKEVNVLITAIECKIVSDAYGIDCSDLKSKGLDGIRVDGGTLCTKIYTCIGTSFDKSED